MKIAFIVGQFPSLSETFILNQITGLIDGGHHVDIYSNKRPPNSSAQPEVQQYGLLERTCYFDIPTNPLVKFSYGFAKFSRNPFQLLPALNLTRFGRMACSGRLLHLLQPFTTAGDYDILHCHFGNIGMLGAMLKQMGVSGKLVVSFHGYDISQVLAMQGAKVYQRLFDQADLLMPISGYWQDRLIQLGADPARIQVHRMGIDLEQFEYLRREAQHVGDVRIITVARLVEKKGIAYAIRALAALCRQHPSWNLHYEIIGDGPLQAELAALVQELGMENNIHLLGPMMREEINQHMRAAHLFVLPSITGQNGDQEGIPVSLMEAMATGLPVLSTFHTGIPELVQDGITGFLVPEGDEAALTSRLEHIIQNPQDWPKMGENGRRFVETHHNIHHLNEQLQETYRALYQEPAQQAVPNLIKN